MMNEQTQYSTYLIQYHDSPRDGNSCVRGISHWVIMMKTQPTFKVLKSKGSCCDTHTGNILTTAEQQALQRATCTISLPTLFSVQMGLFALMSNHKSNQCVLCCSTSSLLWQTHLFQNVGSGTGLMTKKAKTSKCCMCSRPVCFLRMPVLHTPLSYEANVPLP